jgi:hypothetical protein
MTPPPPRYQVLKDTFVYRHGSLVSPVRRQKHPGEFQRGDHFEAASCTLLRRAVRDGYISPVGIEHHTALAKRAPRAPKDAP